MRAQKSIAIALSGGMLLGLGAGCSDLPGGKQTQGTVIGGVAGAAAGALVGGSENRLLGALIGGALGAGGGYLIGSELKKADKSEQDNAVKASEQAQRNPATAEQARRATTADINGDGYVTMDEVVAMHKAGLSDDEMIRRLDKTDMFFELTPEQKAYLRNNGVSDRVVIAMDTINSDVKAKAQERLRKQQSEGSDSIGRT